MNIEKEYKKQLNVMIRETAIEGWSNIGVLILLLEDSELNDLQKDFQKIKEDLRVLIHKMPK